MRIQSLLGKRTWLGLLAAVFVLLAAVAVSSLLIVQGILPEKQAGVCVCVCYGISVLAGCLVAAFRRDHAMVRTTVVACLLLALAWLTALGSSGDIVFEKNAVAITATILLTGVLAGFLSAPAGKRRKKSRRVHPRKR